MIASVYITLQSLYHHCLHYTQFGYLQLGGLLRFELTPNSQWFAGTVGHIRMPVVSSMTVISCYITYPCPICVYIYNIHIYSAGLFLDSETPKSYCCFHAHVAMNSPGVFGFQELALSGCVLRKGVHRLHPCYSWQVKSPFRIQGTTVHLSKHQMDGPNPQIHQLGFTKSCLVLGALHSSALFESTALVAIGISRTHPEKSSNTSSYGIIEKARLCSKPALKDRIQSFPSFFSCLKKYLKNKNIHWCPVTRSSTTNLMNSFVTSSQACWSPAYPMVVVKSISGIIRHQLGSH